jgi:SAM-dependent methyltransferase
MSDVDPTGMFEPLYRSAAAGEATVPWDRGAPHPLIEEWAREVDGARRRTLVVGSGLGADAEFLAQRGFDVVAFDISPTAVASTRDRYPDSSVDYCPADLLDPPAAWSGAFELVVESLTVQSMPIAFHAQATANVARFVAPGGTLLVVATARAGDSPEPDGPPWPLTRAEIEAYRDHGLEPVLIEQVRAEGVPPRWRAELRRP